jgi:hypothetical protein
MPTIIKDESKSMARSHHIFSFIGILLLAVMVLSTFVVLDHSGQRTLASTPPSFSFTYAGDYDQTSQTTANLTYMAQQYAASQIAFNLGLGDFSYNTSVTADAWSTYAHQYLPATFPFEIVDGRHDSSQIQTYEKDLPDHVGGDITGTYGEQYYFDYPTSAPLARFIMISPNQSLYNPATKKYYSYNYNQGGAGYTWVKNAIEAAHQAQIPWVIVGMHEYCFVIGTATCLNQQLLDLLLNEHVDVILQGQKHNYQAGKQLALNSTTCQTLNATNYNANCVANDTTTMTQGKGSVIVVTGTGGASQLAINNNDPKFAYFRTSMPTNNVTWGVSQFTISATQLSENFVDVSGGTLGGNFTDSFTISNSPSTTTTLAQDTFARTPSSLWGTASDSQTWGADANTLSNFSISNNSGQVVGSGSQARGYTGVLGPTATNAEVQVSGSLSSFVSNTLGTVLRWSNNGSNFYRAYLTGKALIITKKVNGKNTQLKSFAFTATPGTSYTLLFSASGSSLAASVWPTSGSNPGPWMVTATDSSLASGNCGILVFLANGVTTFTAFQATSQ